MPLRRAAASACAVAWKALRYQVVIYVPYMLLAVIVAVLMLEAGQAVVEVDVGFPTSMGTFLLVSEYLLLAVTDPHAQCA